MAAEWTIACRETAAEGQFLEDIHLSFGPVLPKWPEGTLDILQCGKSA